MQRLRQDPAAFEEFMRSERVLEVREAKKAGKVIEAQVTHISALEEALLKRWMDIQQEINAAGRSNGLPPNR